MEDDIGDEPRADRVPQVGEQEKIDEADDGHCRDNAGPHAGPGEKPEPKSAERRCVDENCSDIGQDGEEGKEIDNRPGKAAPGIKRGGDGQSKLQDKPGKANSDARNVQQATQDLQPVAVQVSSFAAQRVISAPIRAASGPCIIGP